MDKPDILQLHGLTLEKLEALSYRSQLGIRLKKNLHYFDKDALFKELSDINMWYDNCSLLRDIAVDSRIKSIHSAILKYYRYYPDHQAAKVFNDKLRVADLSNGKANDDGYHGVHVYYQLSSNFVMHEFPGKNPDGSFICKSLETIWFQGFFVVHM